MQTYLLNLAELFKLSSMYRDPHMVCHLCRLLELSLQPTAALAHFQHYKKYFATIADTIVLQEIEDYLIEQSRN